MKGVFEEREVEQAEERRETELTLGSGMLLLIFFGLVLLCGLCFGFGYSMGHHGPQDTSAATDLFTRAAAAVHGNAPQAKPSAEAQTAPASDTADQTSSPSAAQAAPQSGAESAAEKTPETVAEQAAPTQSSATASPAPAASSPAPALVQAAIVKPSATPAAAKSAPTKAADSSQQKPPAAKQVQPKQAAAGPVMVQIAAVADQEDADVLMGALRKRGYSVVAGRDPQDGLIHVRIGPFTTKDEAETWRQKLLNDGYNAIMQP